MKSLSQQAIQAALQNNWDEAIKLNKEILIDQTNNLDALNRLANAYIQINNIDEAKKLYKRILTLDKYNNIALKNLEKVVNLSKRKNSLVKKVSLSPSLFIEEPGRTKTVALKHLAPSSVLANISIGDEVVLIPKKYSIDIRDVEKVYLGNLPDDISFRLIKLIKGGNTYTANVKNITKNSLSVFIKELKRAKKYSNQPSFISALKDKKSHEPKQHVHSNESDDDEADDDTKKTNHDDWEE